MAYTASELSKLNKNDLICITLDMPSNQNSILFNQNNKISERRKKYNKLEADFNVSKSVTEAMKNQIVFLLECKCWSNEQYSTRECLEVFGTPSHTETGKLEETVVENFLKNLMFMLTLKMWKMPLA